MALNGMMTMRLHRLHFSSKAWPLTFAISWPHSQRVSDTSAIVCDEGPIMVVTSLILRTIIKIVGSIGRRPSHCQEGAADELLLPWGISNTV
jgi:hypothetical protein